MLWKLIRVKRPTKVNTDLIWTIMVDCWNFKTIFNTGALTSFLWFSIFVFWCQFEVNMNVCLMSLLQFFQHQGARWDVHYVNDKQSHSKKNNVLLFFYGRQFLETCCINCGKTLLCSFGLFWLLTQVLFEISIPRTDRNTDWLILFKITCPSATHVLPSSNVLWYQ